MRSTSSDGKSSASSSESDSDDLARERCDAAPYDDDDDSDDWSSDESEAGEPDSQPYYDASLDALMQAAEAGDLERVDAALAGLTVPCSSLGPDGDTALHLASLFGHDAVVRKLLDAGADANQPDDGGGLPLHDACASGHIGIVERLLDAAPASVHVQDEDGDTALHNAARGNHADIVRLLLKKGADLNVVNLDGETARDATDSREIQALLSV